MFSRTRGAIILPVLALTLGYVAAATPKSRRFDALDDFEEDFFVAFGGPRYWKVNDGVFECSGKPNGYICTRKSYSNDILKLEFRYPEQAGNTGVLNDISGRHKIWPACVEVQGPYQALAQVFPMGGVKGPRSEGELAALLTARKPHTQWNHFEINSKDGVLSAKLNGVLISRSGPYPIRQGHIGVQSEGAPVHFRNIRIREL